MKILIVLAGPALLFANSAAAAQPVPQVHDQHQATGQHQRSSDEERCCCEEMMPKMKMEMQKHQQKGMSQSTNSDQHAPAADKHQHKQ